MWTKQAIAAAEKAERHGWRIEEKMKKWAHYSRIGSDGRVYLMTIDRDGAVKV